MIISGIDPGSRITGYGVIEQKGNKLTYIASGCIRLTGDELAGRLQQVFQGVSEIISNTSLRNLLLSKYLWLKTRILL